MFERVQAYPECVRIVLGQSLLIRGSAVYFSTNQPKWNMKIRRMKKNMRETVKGAEWTVEEYNTMRMIHG